MFDSIFGIFKKKSDSNTVTPKEIKKAAPKTEKQDSEIVANKKKYLTQIDSVEVLAHKDYFKFLEILIYGLIGLVCICAFVVLNLATSRPNMSFFETNSKGQVVKVHPAGNDGNIISNGSVQQFVLNAIPDSFTFDFNNYNYVFSRYLPKYFTESAANDIKSFMNKNYIPDIVSQKEFFNISVTSSFIIGDGKRFGKKVNEWRIQVPAVVSIFNGVVQKHTNVKFQIVVRYTGTNKNSYGMVISEIKLLNNWGVS